MRRQENALLGLAALLVVAAASTLPAFADVLRVGGTGGGLALILRLADAYHAGELSTGVRIMPSLGSSGGIKAVTDGALDMAITARPLNSEEQGKELTIIPLARTPFVLATSQRDKQSFDSQNIAALLANPQAAWPDGGRIRLIVRPKYETDNAHWQYFPGMRAVLDAYRRRDDVLSAASDQDNAEAAERTAGSLVAMGLVQLIAERRQLQTIAIDGVEPTIENFEKGIYPFEKSFYLVHAPNPTAELENFIRFTKSPAGARAMREVGALAVK
jgi:phosphate transport system substrate-binding protein